MQGGYNINMRCSQKFMFCKDWGISLESDYADDTRDMCAQYTFGDFHFTTRGRKKGLFPTLDFQCRRDQKILKIELFLCALCI